MTEDKRPLSVLRHAATINESKGAIPTLIQITCFSRVSQSPLLRKNSHFGQTFVQRVMADSWRQKTQGKQLFLNARSFNYHQIMLYLSRKLKLIP